MSALRFSSRFNPMLSNTILVQTKSLLFSFSSFSSSVRKPCKTLCCSTNSLLHTNGGTSNSSPLSGLEDELVGYIFGKKKATEVAHLVWRHVLHKGDIVIDATCGNGYDTVAMLKMVADESGHGRVYGIDIQTEALENTSSLLDETVTQKEKELVKLFPICHSRMDEVLPENTAVRLVAFNLGYLPGGDKGIITTSKTTLLALEASKKMLILGGLISLVVYVGHPGGRLYSQGRIGNS
ncbi:hypothetical protein ES319_A13G138200v1 [Gossypium barbadense]|uniref:Methyltransferase domain-containing protein n=3 Tax=Gossypium TaxID=3633 RepID=A0A5J5T2U0_GOSBA|nr:hypothetical protein ES319_A13G138200v1 [Gossypium barbadense]TYG86606.1 hypothetical protein ES288_A13G146900v1 [Gossypium darwinii]TYH91954.1 hypothetical protein ES332_A13G149600v1 [Gossypium tomentosum]